MSILKTIFLTPAHYIAPVMCLQELYIKSDANKNHLLQ